MKQICVFFKLPYFLLPITIYNIRLGAAQKMLPKNSFQTFPPPTLQQNFLRYLRLSKLPLPEILGLTL